VVSVIIQFLKNLLGDAKMVSDVKILIVDDGSLSSLPVLTGLKKNGFNYIDLAINSNCMFDYLDRSDFGLIISNWSRIDMHGKEFINLLRKQPGHKDIPLVLLTHPSVTMDIQDGLWEEDIRFVSNPLDFKILGDTIREIMEKKETLK
jgi:response regulator RpfG family c-di-GMP phosphodiesterase